VVVADLGFCFGGAVQLLIAKVIKSRSWPNRRFKLGIKCFFINSSVSEVIFFDTIQITLKFFSPNPLSSDDHAYWFLEGFEI